jgi:polyferredoxin
MKRKSFKNDDYISFIFIIIFSLFGILCLWSAIRSYSDNESFSGEIIGMIMSITMVLYLFVKRNISQKEIRRRK